MAGTLIRLAPGSGPVRRLVASIRLSALTDSTNAPATQRADITAWVADHPDCRIVAWVEDLDVSGAVPIAERQGIGAIFAPDKLDVWDGIIGHRLDRLFRDQLDYLLFVRDLGEKYGKYVIDAEDSTDSSTRAGRDILNDRARLAQRERERIADRRARAAQAIRQEARYNGGPVPFGYRKAATRNDDGKITGWMLQIYEPYAAEVRDWATRILAGESVNSIVQDINARKIPTMRDAQRILAGQKPQGSIWQVSSMLRYLRSPVLKGWILNYPNKARGGDVTVVRGSDGLPLRRPAILDDDVWDDLQAALRDSGYGRLSGRRADAVTLLLGIAYCGIPGCGGRLHRQSRGPSRPNAHYYLCANARYHGCPARLIPEAELDSIICDSFQDPQVAASPVIRIDHIRSNERERKLKDVGQAIADLTQERYVQGIDRPDFDDVMAGLQAEHARLRVAEDEPAQEIRVPTGETVGQLWARLDTQGRRAFLLQVGFRWYVRRDDDGQLRGWIERTERPKYVTLQLPELLEAG